MKGTGWTLIIAAVILHFTMIRWENATWGDSHIFAFFHAKPFTKLVREHGTKVITHNKRLSCVLGLLVPAIMTTSGFALIIRASDNEQQTRKWKHGSHGQSRLRRIQS